MAVEADTIALALAAIALGVAVAGRVIRAVTRPRWQGPRIRSAMRQIGFREPEKISNIKADMQNDRYEFNAPRGQIAGNRDPQGTYYITEGHHRMAAAMEIFEETGDPSNVNRLLENGHWTAVERPPINGPLPRR
jgi:filamentous hemagglutinin